MKKKRKEGSLSDIEFKDPSSDEDDVDYSFTDSDSQDSDDTDIENVDGVNEENVKRYFMCYC